jgi:hypothetical protein
MTIHEYRRIPPVEYIGKEPSDFRGFCFHGIAVQVKRLTVMPYPYSIGRAVLVGPVPGADHLISVRIENGTYQENDMVEQQ